MLALLIDSNETENASPVSWDWPEEDAIEVNPA